MRQRFFHSVAPGGLAGDRRGVVPANAFAFSAKQMWQVIKDNKDLDLPAHKVIFLATSSSFVTVPSSLVIYAMPMRAGHGSNCAMRGNCQ